MTPHLAAGLAELREGASNWRIWRMLGANEIRRRYARSRLGQFWLALSAGISIAIIGVMWSLLWKVELREFLPFIAISMLIWQLMSGIVSESTGAFTGSAHTLLSQRIACSTLVYAAVYRNLLVFLHNLVIVAIVFVVFLRPVGWSALLALPALALMSITAVWLGQLIGLACARFRDLQHVTQAVLQLGFYVTPVIWKPDFLAAELRWLEYVNPFAIYLAILRGPILGAPFDPLMWALAVAISFGGLALSLTAIGRYRRRMLFWL